MGYLFLFGGLISGVSKGYCGKKVSCIVKSLREILLAYFIRMAICVLVGVTLVIAFEGTDALNIGIGGLLISLLSGVFSALFVVSWVICVQNGAYMLTDVFSTMGVALPIILSMFFFNEHVKFTQWIGFIVLICAVAVMCSYNNSIKKKMSVKTLLALLVCGISNGISSFSQKLFVNLVSGGSALVFNFYTYLFAAFVLAIGCLVYKEKNKQNEKTFSKVWGYIVIMSLFLFMNSYFLTMAAKYLDSVLLYPLNTGTALVLSAIMSSVCFGEKITKKCVSGILITFFALLLINVL